MLVNKAITLINLLLIALSAYTGVGLFYRLVGIQTQAGEKAAASATVPSPQALPANLPIEHYRPILERDLFHTRKAANAAASQTTVNSQSLDNLEETKLKLKLWGTVSGEPQQAYAVIEDPQKKEQNLYRIGDQIQQATLKNILREKVVLQVGGKDEMLSMEDMTINKSAPSAPSREMPSREPDDAGLNEPPSKAQQVALNKSMIDDALQDVAKLMTEISVTPHTEEGQPGGLSLSNIKPNSIFRRMGLRNGDILVGVDGQEIRSVDDALRFYESLKNSSEVKVQINRRGQERTIDYSIR